MLARPGQAGLFRELASPSRSGWAGTVGHRQHHPAAIDPGSNERVERQWRSFQAGADPDSSWNALASGADGFDHTEEVARAVERCLVAKALDRECVHGKHATRRPINKRSTKSSCGQSPPSRPRVAWTASYRAFTSRRSLGSGTVSSLGHSHDVAPGDALALTA